MARLDTGWHAHPRILQLGLQAMGMHAWSISYCDHARSDGFIPFGAWPALSGAGAAVKALLDAELWARVDGGFMLHDYLDYNRSKAQIEAARADDRTRKRKPDSGRNPGGIPLESNGTSGPDSGRIPRAPGPGPGPGVNH